MPWSNLLQKPGRVQVFRAYDLKTGMEVALKIHTVDKKVPMGQREYVRRAIREVAILEGLHHHSIVRLLEVFQISDTSLAIAMEACRGAPPPLPVSSQRRDLIPEASRQFIRTCCLEPLAAQTCCSQRSALPRCRRRETGAAASAAGSMIDCLFDAPSLTSAGQRHDTGAPRCRQMQEQPVATCCVLQAATCRATCKSGATGSCPSARRAPSSPRCSMAWSTSTPITSCAMRPGTSRCRK